MSLIRWNLSDLKQIIPINKTVFSCFCCGGGSTMGYKLAGYTSLGGNEIDPKMSKIYKTNHNPSIFYQSDIRDLINLELDKKLNNIDILDGSPPCSVFSTASTKRENFWGKEKKFKEGQKKQRLDDLFFHFLDLANKIKPKVIVTENVKGLIMSKAKNYARKIIHKFKSIDYHVQVFLLNSKYMNVPQSRERVFFIGIRNDIYNQLIEKNKNFKLKMQFNNKIISVKEAIFDLPNSTKELAKSTKQYELWLKTKAGKNFSFAAQKLFNTNSFFSNFKVHPNLPVNTITAGGCIYHYERPVKITGQQIARLQSFPDDYNFCKSDAKYICGMSVPPMMIKNIALELNNQIFDKI